MWKLLLCLMLPAAAAAQTCKPGATERAATVTLALQARLLAGFAPAMEPDVPLPLRPVLHDFKQSLISTVDVALRCNNPDPAQLQSNLATLLHANKPVPPAKVYDPKVPDPTTGIYGAYLAVAVKPVSGQPDLFTLQWSYGIECGDDNILLVYRRTAQGYRRELVWQNPDLNSIGDALGDIFYFAPVPAPMPAFVILHGHPWCTSNFSGFGSDLVATAAPTTPQRLLDHTEAFYYRDEDVKFSTRPDGFEVRATGMSKGTDILRRPVVLRYATASGHLVQQAVAPSAPAFVDLWLNSDWKIAHGWGDAGSESHLKKLHDDMNAEGSDFLQFGPTLACAGHYQVELDLQADHTTSNLQIIDLPSKYAQVRTNANTFTLLDITDKADPTCHGPDLMAPAAGSARKRAK